MLVNRGLQSVNTDTIPSKFIGPMTIIFDNPRKFNPNEKHPWYMFDDCPCGAKSEEPCKQVVVPNGNGPYPHWGRPMHDKGLGENHWKQRELG